MVDTHYKRRRSVFVVFRVRQEAEQEHFAGVVVQGANQPVAVAANVKHHHRIATGHTHLIRRTKAPAQIGKMPKLFCRMIRRQTSKPVAACGCRAARATKVLSLIIRTHTICIHWPDLSTRIIIRPMPGLTRNSFRPSLNGTRPGSKRGQKWRQLLEPNQPGNHSFFSIFQGKNVVFTLRFPKSHSPRQHPVQKSCGPCPLKCVDLLAVDVSSGGFETVKNSQNH